MGAVKKALVSGEYEVLMAENCGMEGERLIGRAQDIPEDAGYYSLVIVKEKPRDRPLNKEKKVIRLGTQEKPSGYGPGQISGGGH